MQRNSWVITRMGGGLDDIDRQGVYFADGSSIILERDATLEMDCNAEGWDCVVQGGKVFLTVAHDAHQPFKVRAWNVMVQSTEGCFSIELARDTQLVTVEVGEGTVHVEVMRKAASLERVVLVAGQSSVFHGIESGGISAQGRRVLQ